MSENVVYITQVIEQRAYQHIDYQQFINENRQYTV